MYDTEIIYSTRVLNGQFVHLVVHLGHHRWPAFLVATISHPKALFGPVADDFAELQAHRVDSTLLNEVILLFVRRDCVEIESVRTIRFVRIIGILLMK